MWRSQEERWRSEHAVRKSRMDDLFATIKSQVSFNYVFYTMYLNTKRSKTIFIADGWEPLVKLTQLSELDTFMKDIEDSFSIHQKQLPSIF